MVGLVASVAGSLLGTWVAGQLDSTPPVQLAGAVLGALVPAVVAELLTSTRTRPAVALVIAAVAIALTYVSFTTGDYATESAPTFPLPPGAPWPSGEVVERDGELAIEVTPEKLVCTADGCSEEVRIENAGEVPLRVDAIEDEGVDAESFEPEVTCAHRTLQKSGDSCAFEVRFQPSGKGGTATATLVIHQNLPDFPTYVSMSGENGGGENGGDDGGEDGKDEPPEVVDPRFVIAGTDSLLNRICVGDQVQIVAEATDSAEISEFIAFYSWVTNATDNGHGGPVTMRLESGSTHRSAIIDISADGDYSFTIRATDDSGQSRTAEATVDMLPGTICGPISDFRVSP